MKAEDAKKINSTVTGRGIRGKRCSSEPNPHIQLD